jgi:hypothetical protein
MRDTLIVVAVLAGITVGYLQMRRTASQSAPSAQTGLTSSSPTSRSNQAKHHKQGAQNERSTFEQAVSSEASGTQEGASGETAEAQGITSIYSQPGQAKKSPRIKAKAKVSKKRPAIGGFDTDSYIAAQRNNFHQYPVAGPADQGVRVFLMCMEVKGTNLESKSARDCRALYKDSIASRPVGLRD